MQGYVIFNGGDAFSRDTRPLDRTWLKLLRQQGDKLPRITVLPTADTFKPQKAAYVATQYLNTLNTMTDYKLITTRQEADTRVEYEGLDKVDAIVLTDGSALDLIERVQETQTFETMRRAIYERKAAVMGVGASAMALGAVHWFGNAWEPGFALMPQIAVLAQHNFVRMRFSPERLLAELPEGVTLIGVDPLTALIAYPDGSYHVAGEGKVTVYRNVKQLDEYETGQNFTLAPA
ncbi:MAG: Type 1 glutamine amidotransferase-like domain-containing protein [Anaerolineae bacterium]|nr:Type 1 glutamine amidotransferase-like domain-containing protein [Anaerolineae bacterium]